MRNLMVNGFIREPRFVELEMDFLILYSFVWKKARGLGDLIGGHGLKYEADTEANAADKVFFAVKAVKLRGAIVVFFEYAEELGRKVLFELVFLAADEIEEVLGFFVVGSGCDEGGDVVLIEGGE